MCYNSYLNISVKSFAYKCMYMFVCVGSYVSVVDICIIYSNTILSFSLPADMQFRFRELTATCRMSSGDENDRDDETYCDVELVPSSFNFR